MLNSQGVWGLDLAWESKVFFLVVLVQVPFLHFRTVWASHHALLSSRHANWQIKSKKKKFWLRFPLGKKMASYSPTIKWNTFFQLINLFCFQFVWYVFPSFSIFSDEICDSSPTFQHTRKSIQGIYPGDKITYTCIPHYAFPDGSRTRTLTCDNEGHWGDITEKCKG